MVWHGRQVFALAVVGATLYVGGSFTAAGGQAAARVAAWNGVAWSPLGVGFDSDVEALAFFDGSLHAGGFFSGVVARWDPADSQWLRLPESPNRYSVNALATFNTVLAVGGNPYFVFWDGETWSYEQTGGPNDFLVTNDEQGAAGRLFGLKSHVSEWLGSAWEATHNRLRVVRGVVWGS